MARSGFTGLVVSIDQWQANSPAGGEIAGDWALVGASGSGAFASQSNNLAFYNGAAWRFIAATALRGVWLFRKSSNQMYWHDGTNPVGPLEGTYTLDTDGTLAANSDTRVPSQKAVKTYVDAMVAGLKWKAPVRVATTAAGTLASSFENGDTVDGVTLATNDRILIKNQAAGAENGIYTVNASGAPTRATDADTGAELVQAAVFVLAGTANADKAFVCTNDAITLNSTSVTFVAFTSALGALLASNNLSDLPSPIAARANLSVYSIADTDTALNLKLDASKIAQMSTDGSIPKWDSGNSEFEEIPPPAADDTDYVLVANRSSGTGETTYTYVLRSAL